MNVLQTKREREMYNAKNAATVLKLFAYQTEC